MVSDNIQLHEMREVMKVVRAYKQDRAEHGRRLNADDAWQSIEEAFWTARNEGGICHAQDRALIQDLAVEALGFLIEVEGDDAA